MEPINNLRSAEKNKLKKILEQNLYNINVNRNINDFSVQISFNSHDLLYLDDLIDNLKVAIFDKKFHQKLDINSYFYTDASSLPIPSDSTNLVILDHGFEVFDDFNILADEIDRILMSSGHVIFFVYNPYSFYRLYNKNLKGRYKVNVVNARNEFLLRSYEYINDYKIYNFYDNLFLNIFKLLQLVPSSHMCIMQKMTKGIRPVTNSWKERFSNIIPEGLVQPNYEKNSVRMKQEEKL